MTTCFYITNRGNKWYNNENKSIHLQKVICMQKKIFLILLVCLFSLGACTFERDIQSTVATDVYAKGDNKEIAKASKENRVEIKITAVGDIMVHGPQLRAQYNEELKVYDFRNNFKFIKPYIEDADIALCNLETTFAGEKLGYSSFPRFNTPDALGDALKDTGFDVIVTANNHTLDKGKQGVLRTMGVLKQLGLSIIGTQEEKEEENFIIKEVKNTKIAMIAYTYETPKYGEYKTLNALPIPKDLEKNINTFNYDTLDANLKGMQQEIQKMKDYGAEIIVFYLHWGNEYQQNPNEQQRKIAQALASFGVDIIFGSHPHVLQPIEWIPKKEGIQKTMVVYSMGNFLSNQRYEIMKNRYTEDGMIVNAIFNKNLDNNRITLKEICYTPTWVHKYLEKGKRIYEILPLTDALNHPTAYHLTNKTSLWRAENSKNNTIRLIESSPTSKHILLAPPMINSIKLDGK